MDDKKTQFDHNSQHNNLKKKIALFSFFVLCVVSFSIWYFAFPKTVDSRNGVKHKIGKFNETCNCNECGGPTRSKHCENKSIHKIEYVLFDLFYCDDCWNHNGEDYFKYLCNFSKDNKTDSDINAWVCAQEVVRQNLKSPTTAKFCSYADAEINNLGNNKYLIIGTVTAQNSFGAELTSSFNVTLTLTDSGYKEAQCTID